MSLILDTEQEELRELARRMLSRFADSRALREAAASDVGFDRRLWSDLAVSGLVGLAVPEQWGGSGAGPVERAVLLEELGRAMVPHPYLSTAVLAVDVLMDAGDDGARGAYLPAIAAGELLAAVAVAEGDRAWPDDGGAVSAVTTAGAWRLTGAKAPVMHADTAGVLFVWCRTDDGPAWFAVDPAASGVQVVPLASVDPTRRYARVELNDAAAVRIGSGRAGSLARIRDQAVVALAAEQVGGLGRILEMTAEYAKTRTQFGRPIGSFQAVKHGLADVYCSWELAVSVLRHAAWTAAERPDELPVAAAHAGAYIPGAFFAAAQAGIQYHGGIGFTAEHDAHLYFSRAKAGELIFGGTSERLALLADLTCP